MRFKYQNSGSSGQKISSLHVIHTTSRNVTLGILLKTQFKFRQEKVGFPPIGHSFRAPQVVNTRFRLISKTSRGFYPGSLCVGAAAGLQGASPNFGDELLCFQGFYSFYGQKTKSVAGLGQEQELQHGALAVCAQHHTNLLQSFVS